MVLPEGKDPDDVIKDNPGEWERLLGEAAPVVDYTFELVVSRLDVTKARTSRRPSINCCLSSPRSSTPSGRPTIFRNCPARWAWTSRSWTAALGQIKQKRPGPRREVKATPLPNRLMPHVSSGDSLAEYCLYLLFSYPDLRSHASDLRVDFFLNTEDREIFLAWQNTTISTRCARHWTLAFRSIWILFSPGLGRRFREGRRGARLAPVRQPTDRSDGSRISKRRRRLISEPDAAGNLAELEELQRESGSVKLYNAELGGGFLHGKEERKRASD